MQFHILLIHYFRFIICLSCSWLTGYGIVNLQVNLADLILVI